MGWAWADQVTEAAASGAVTRTSCGTAPSLLSAAGVPARGGRGRPWNTSTRVTSTVYRHPTTPLVESAVAPMDQLFDRSDEQ
jgi:hypothetical protein